MKIEEMNQDNVELLLEECRKALEPVAQKFGLDLQRKNCTFKEKECPVPFLMKATSVDKYGNVLSQEVVDFQDRAILYGLKKEDLGRTFEKRGKQFKIVGLRPRNHKYPIICEATKTGKKYKFPAETVVKFLK